jgi:hypothetical protein
MTIQSSDPPYPCSATTPAASLGWSPPSRNIVWMGLKRWRVPLCGLSRCRGMPSANTLPAVTSRQAPAIVSAVM